MISDKELIDLAKNAMQFAYSPYYNFKVGSAILLSDGTVFTGCNIENAAGFSLCAERVAFSKAISEGKTDIVRVAVVSESDAVISPCGVCRQFMFEFAPNCEVIMTGKDVVKKVVLKDLLPNTFKL